MRATLSRLLIGLIPAIALSLTGCATPFAIQSPVAYFEHQQVFQPEKYNPARWDKGNLPIEDAWIISDDGLQLHGWYLPHEDPVGVALFAHGNAGNVSTQLETLRVLHDRHRLSIMTFDYRGYGRSDGYPTEDGILADAQAARLWLARREKMDEKDIILLGHSLGGAVAVDLAARDGARGLIIASTFTSLPDVAHYHAPLLPTSMMENRLDSLQKIGKYHGPLLQIHGDKDHVIPYKLGRKLFDAANEPKTFVTKAGCDHEDPMSDKERMALDKFLSSLPPVSSREDAGEQLSQVESPTVEDDFEEPHRPLTRTAARR